MRTENFLRNEYWPILKMTESEMNHTHSADSLGPLAERLVGDE